MLLSRAAVLTVLTVSLGSAIALAVSHPLLPQAVAQNRDRPNRPHRGMSRWIQQLNLSPEQMQQMQAIRNQYKDRMSQRAQALRQAQQQLQDLMAGNASEDQILAQYNQVETLRQQLGRVRFESMLRMRQVLTPEQRRQFAERMQNRRANLGNRMGSR
jgi:periplasmic protein CpxP/Spy